MTVDHICLRVPGDDRYTPLVRLAATQLAAQVGFDTDRIEDVRMAISEAARILTDDGAPALSTEFAVATDGFDVRMVRSVRGAAARVDRTTERILRAATTRYGLDLADGSPASVSVAFHGNHPEGPEGREEP